jgi:ribosomal protein L28
MFRPNVQRHRFVEDGKAVRKNVCTSCLRTILKQMKK